MMRAHHRHMGTWHMAEHEGEVQMRTVYKWPVDPNDEITLNIPKGAEILTFQMQDDVPTLWALVDPEAETEQRHFQLAGTGHPIDEAEVGYIDSIQMMGGQPVFHLFEVRRMATLEEGPECCQGEGPCQHKSVCWRCHTPTEDEDALGYFECPECRGKREAKEAKA